MQIGFLLYPQVTQLDVTGPAQVLSLLPHSTIHMLWKERTAVPTDAGFAIVATTALDDSPRLDVLCVPGGPGQKAVMDDEEVIDFVRRQGATARYVTSVCSGSLLLARAGLLEGYEAGCHWAWCDALEQFGAKPVRARVVRDRNRFTGGGVTAGIDFGLTLAAEIAGEPFARMIQLGLEYDPEPPFDVGSPEKAGPELEALVRSVFADGYEPI